jgi:hypothetical protein
MATTAVVAGTATAVSGRVSRRQAGRDQQAADAQAYQEMPAQPEPMPAPAPAPAAGGLTPEAMEQLQQLAGLKEQGILTEAEFATQKARILGA